MKGMKRFAGACAALLLMCASGVPAAGNRIRHYGQGPSGTGAIARWATYQQVYTDEIADRYVSGGSIETRYALLDMARGYGALRYISGPHHRQGSPRCRTPLALRTASSSAPAETRPEAGNLVW